MNAFELKRLKGKLRKDARLVRLKKAFDTLPEYSLDRKAIIDEIQQIHMVRKTRLLDRNVPTFTTDIVEGMLDDQAHRSRLSEILISCVKVIKHLNSTLSSIESYLIVAHGDELGTIRTKGERQAFVRNQVLNIFFSYINDVEEIKSAAEIVIVDIDKAGYMYRNLIEAVKLVANKREIV